MSYAWKEEADKVAGKCPKGVHRLKVARLLRSGKGGSLFTSSKGDPQLMVIFENPDGAEVGEMLTLSDKAAWKLSKLLSRGGADLEQMERDGIEPKHFANEAIAEQYLLGMETWAEVTYEEGRDGKSYGRVDPLFAAEAGHGEEMSQERPEPRPARRSQPVAAGAVAADPFAGSPDEDDIPF